MQTEDITVYWPFGCSASSCFFFNPFFNICCRHWNYVKRSTVIL